MKLKTTLLILAIVALADAARRSNGHRTGNRPSSRGQHGGGSHSNGHQFDGQRRHDQQVGYDNAGGDHRPGDSGRDGDRPVGHDGMPGEDNEDINPSGNAVRDHPGKPNDGDGDSSESGGTSDGGGGGHGRYRFRQRNRNGSRPLLCRCNGTGEWRGRGFGRHNHSFDGIPFDGSRFAGRVRNATGDGEAWRGHGRFHSRRRSGSEQRLNVSGDSSEETHGRDREDGQERRGGGWLNFGRNSSRHTPFRRGQSGKDREDGQERRRIFGNFGSRKNNTGDIPIGRGQLRKHLNGKIPFVRRNHTGDGRGPFRLCRCPDGKQRGPPEPEIEEMTTETMNTVETETIADNSDNSDTSDTSDTSDNSDNSIPSFDYSNSFVSSLG